MKTYTRHKIDYTTLFFGFGVELGFIDASMNSILDLEKEVDNLTDEQFELAMKALNY